MPADLSNFGLTEMLRCSRELHRAAANAPTMETSARRICRSLYDQLVMPNGSRACALVRCYKTHPFGDLPLDLRRYARRASGEIEEPPATMSCLTLLASAGSEPQWNSRASSKSHQAIPLPSPRIVERAPMISQLIKDFGLALSDVTNPSPDVVRNFAGKTYGVFHVEDAVGNPSIPAQEEFVVKHGIRSAVGFGGALASGNLFAVIIFSRVTVPVSAAERIRTLALDVKALFFPFGESAIFDVGVPIEPADGAQDVRA